MLGLPAGRKQTRFFSLENHCLGYVITPLSTRPERKDILGLRLAAPGVYRH